jgi:hypothetical protein
MPIGKLYDVTDDNTTLAHFSAARNAVLHRVILKAT